MEKPSDRNRAFARRSRGALTDTENALWTLLRDRRLHGVKFRRQVPIGPHVADFACHVLKLIIEADGGVHRLREVADANRGRLAGGGGIYGAAVRKRDDPAKSEPRI